MLQFNKDIFFKILLINKKNKEFAVETQQNRTVYGIQKKKKPKLFKSVFRVHFSTLYLSVRNKRLKLFSIYKTEISSLKTDIK